MATHTNTFIGFPIFSLHKGTLPADESRGPAGAIVISGGGGSTNSGIKNSIRVLSIENNQDQLPQAITKYEYPTDLVIPDTVCISPSNQFIAAAANGFAFVLEYNLKHKRFDRVAEFQSDFTESSPKQNVCRFAHDTSLLATGGEDCIVRVWTIGQSSGPVSQALEDKDAVEQEGKGVEQETKLGQREIKLRCKLQGHTKGIRDLAFHPSNRLIASVSEDGVSRLWNVETGKMVQILPADTSRGLTYRACRFASPTCLVTLQIPKGRLGMSYLVVWHLNLAEGEAFEPSKKWTLKGVCKVAEKKRATSLGVSPDGGLVAVGGADGSISVFQLSTMRRTKHLPDVHGLPVTGVEFSTTIRKDGRVFPNMLYVVSTSVDKLVSIVPVPTRVKRRGVCSYLFWMLFWCVVGLGLYAQFVDQQLKRLMLVRSRKFVDKTVVPFFNDLEMPDVAEMINDWEMPDIERMVNDLVNGPSASDAFDGEDEEDRSPIDDDESHDVEEVDAESSDGGIESAPVDEQHGDEDVGEVGGDAGYVGEDVGEIDEHAEEVDEGGRADLGTPPSHGEEQLDGGEDDGELMMQQEDDIVPDARIDEDDDEYDEYADV